MLALLHTQQGRSEDALATYDILAAEGEIGADLHQARGDSLQGLGRFEAAVEAYDAALAREPARVEALNNRAAALEAMGRLEAALLGFEAVLSILPDHARVLYNRGGVLTALGRSTESLDGYDRVLELRPDFAPAHNNRALVLATLGRFEEAVAAYDAALALAAEDASTWSNRSAALRALRRLDEALDSARRALALRPDFPDALNAEGLALAAMNRFEAALASYERALLLKPDHRDALNNAGVTLAALRRFNEAEACHEAALALGPSFAEAEYNLGLLALRLGDPRGWRRHEARWRRAGQPGPTYPDAHLWLGVEDIAGSTLLLHAEQGLGDTIQFARYASHVRARGAKVVLQVQPALKRLMQGLDGADAVVAIGESLPSVDRHIPLMSLPLVFGVEGGAPYLHADPAAATLWRERLPADRVRVGLVWAGNPAHGNDANRSLALSALAPLLERAATFISLQRDVPPTDVSMLAETGIRPFPASISDFADTAALIEALDLVITVDTSVAHLAAALGRPTWVLLPRFPDWRWGEESDETPWYPTMRLFRQRGFGQWDDVVEAVGAALDLVMASRAA